MRTNLNQPQLGMAMVELSEKAHANFEGKECIYIEKGALRVRIGSIWGSASQAVIFANVEEIATPGLGVGLLDRESGFFRPHWRISAGYMTNFSNHSWAMGYGGWALYFDNRIIQGVIELASQFPVESDRMERYHSILKYINKERLNTNENNRQSVPSGT